jgi:hypothetical protein
MQDEANSKPTFIGSCVICACFGGLMLLAAWIVSAFAV